MLGSGATRAMWFWPKAQPATDWGWLVSLSTLGITAAILLPWVFIGLVVWNVWPVIKGIVLRLDALERMRQTIPYPEPPQAFLRLDEEPLPSGKVAADFWRRVHGLPEWKVLAHYHQAEARTYLSASRAAAEAGNEAGALFAAGRAHEAAYWAVRPEYRVQQAMARVREQEARIKEDAEMTGVGERPGSRWHEREGAGDGKQGS